MDFENEKRQEEQTAQEQQQGSREGYQKEFRPVGRSPRPRISTGQRAASGYERPNYNKHNSDDEGGFRPEGFGAGLQGAAPQRGGYRPRNNYNHDGGYQSRQQGGYRPRPQYGQQDGGYQSRPQQGGYRPRPQ